MKIIKCLCERFTGFCELVKKNPMYIASMLVITVAMIVLLDYLFMVVLPVKTLTVNSATMEYETYEPGDNLDYKLEWCSHGNFSITVHTRMTDGFVRALPEYETTIPVDGCFESHITTLQLPHTAQPGRYYLQVELVVHVNRLRDEIVTFETNCFEVVAPTK